jgi:hypothetical protein
MGANDVNAIYTHCITSVGAPGFEPGASATRTQRSSRTEPRPDLVGQAGVIITEAPGFGKYSIKLLIRRLTLFAVFPV